MTAADIVACQSWASGHETNEKNCQSSVSWCAISKLFVRMSVTIRKAMKKRMSQASMLNVMRAGFQKRRCHAAMPQPMRTRMLNMSIGPRTRTE